MKKNKQEAYIKQITDKFGKGAIMLFGDSYYENIEVIPTGSIKLDKALGVGGVPRGRIIEVFGGESSGKTTLTLHIIAETQKLGGKCAFIDAEHALDPEYSKKIGVDIKKLYISQPDTGEQALEILEFLVRSNEMSTIVIDSVSSLVPQAEIEGEMGASHMGLQARLMSQALRKLTGIVSRTKTVVIFINQTRMKIGQWGDPETTSGGKALPFYATQRIKVAKGKTLKDGETKVGQEMKINIVKNKVATPYKITKMMLMYGEGISVIDEIIDLGMENKILKKEGNTLYFGEIKLGVGRTKVKEFLKENPKTLEEIKSKIIK